MPTTTRANAGHGGQRHTLAQQHDGQNGDQHGADATSDGVDQPQVASGVGPAEHDEVEGLQRCRSEDEPVPRRGYGVEQEQHHAQGQQDDARADE